MKMTKKSFNFVLNSSLAVEKAKSLIEKKFIERTQSSGELFHFFLKEYQAPKTHKQLGGIRILCDQMSKTESNTYAGHDSDYWYRHYKLRAYVPLLEANALETNDAELVALISSARQLIKAMRGASLFNFDLAKVLASYNEYLLKSFKHHRNLPEKERIAFHEVLNRAAKNFSEHHNKSELGKPDDGYTAADFIADNPAFSYANASKEHLVKVIDYMMKDAAEKGIYLELKKDGE